MVKVPEIISCDSEYKLEYELQDVQEGLAVKETEDTWEKLLYAVQRLNALAKGGACEFPDTLVLSLKEISQSLNLCMTTERSRLSGATIECIATLTEGLREYFKPLIPSFFPTLLLMTTRSNKVFVNRARVCIMCIVEHTQSPTLLPHFRRAVSDKSKSLRLVATDATLACLRCFNPPDLESNARGEDIETIIRITAKDADAEVRKSSRLVFDAYRMLLPGRVDAFVSPLTPVMRKYLDIKGNAHVRLQTAVASSRTTRTGQSSSSLSASTTSTQTTKREDRMADIVESQRIAHKKTLSSSTASSSRGQVAEPIPVRTLKGPPVRPPPELKNVQVGFPVERAPMRTARMPADAPTRPTDAPFRPAQEKNEPARHALASSGGAVQRPFRPTANQATSSQDIGANLERMDVCLSRPDSRNDVLMTSAPVNKAVRPVSIRERLMGTKRAQQQQQHQQQLATQEPAMPEGRDQKPQRIEKRANVEIASRPGSALGRKTIPPKEQSEAVKASLSKSTDQGERDKKRSDVNIAVPANRDMLPPPVPSISKPAKAASGGPFAPTKSQLAKAKAKMPISSPKKAVRVISKRAIQPLAVRKTARTRAVAKPLAVKFAPSIIASKGHLPSLLAEGCDGEDEIDTGTVTVQNPPPRTRSKSPESAPNTGTTACDPLPLTLPPSPKEAVISVEKEDASQDEEELEMIPPPLPPTPPKQRHTRVSPMTPITKLVSQIEHGFDYTVCLDETLPYPVADVSHAGTDNELACIDFIMDGVDTGGGVISSPRKRNVDRRVLWESNS